MKTVFKILCVFLATAVSVSALTITFDNLPSGLAVPTNYDGFVWNRNFDVVNGSGLFSPYHNGIVSPNNAVINIDGRAEEISGPIFDLDSAYLSIPSQLFTGLPVSPNRVSLDVQGYLNGVLLYDDTFTVSNVDARLFTFNFLGVNDIKFIASEILLPIISTGGPAPSAQPIFIMDNLTVRTPDSAATVLLLGLSAGFLFRFKRKFCSGGNRMAAR